MTASIYWLTGVIGSGKSTLGAALAAYLPKTHFIDGDFFIAEAEDLPFAERVALIKERLLDKCCEAAAKGQSLVIAYPIWKETVDDLRKRLKDTNASLVVIGIETPPQSSIRNYTAGQLQRKKEMIDCNGTGYADIMTQHPTRYLHDSLKLLIDKIKTFVQP